MPRVPIRTRREAVGLRRNRRARRPPAPVGTIRRATPATGGVAGPGARTRTRHRMRRTRRRTVCSRWPLTSLKLTRWSRSGRARTRRSARPRIPRASSCTRAKSSTTRRRWAISLNGFCRASSRFASWCTLSPMRSLWFVIEAKSNGNFSTYVNNVCL